ncbi:hypothetical protein GV819_00760 [Pseudomonas sp. Fl5BN2]|uniref:hypothetical protein n=1 Tax=Pseudomonas sp. Fl5BN2 TaxID=2697652 RepID=UPI001377EF09|nr:hypothetical protein [Pseudomonas sp. Fl5BN2]NBF00812.1 hypothetical protein [Pseudomonas sp. Fl5BN2]
MKRRAFVAGLCVFASGTSAVLGYRLGQRSPEEPVDFRAFLQGNPDVKFHHMPPDLLIKLYSRNLTDQDRQSILHHLVHHNRSLFVAEPYARTLGTPGFYRVTG